MRVKFEWISSGTVYLETVSEDEMEELARLRPGPCDVEDLSPRIQTKVKAEILDTVLDAPIQICGIAEVSPGPKRTGAGT